MTYFAVEYDYAADSSEITDIRPSHREFLGSLKEEGILIGSGPYTDGQGGALIVIKLNEGATIDDATALMDKDPFHVKNAISGRRIHTWNPVLNVFPV